MQPSLQLVLLLLEAPFWEGELLVGQEWVHEFQCDCPSRRSVCSGSGARPTRDRTRSPASRRGHRITAAAYALRRARKIARPDEAYYFDMLKRLGRAHEADESPESARKIYEEYVAKAPDGDAGLPSIRRRLERL